MVSWKEELSNKVEGKASRLTNIDGLDVPSFFVITSDEIGEMFSSSEPEQALDASFSPETRDKVRKAYDEVGIGSEVRNAPDRAKNLVEGQRNGQPVSVRVSDGEKEENDYRLNVTSSDLFDAIREVVASYYSHSSGNPSVIVQKMVEPGFSGTLEMKEKDTIIEFVEGLGKSLEEGITRPHVIHLRNSNIEQALESDQQTVITHSSVTGRDQRSTEENTELPFSKQEVQSLVKTARSEGYSLKFVYKRGSFHVVDAYESKSFQEAINMSKRGIRVSKGMMQGRVGGGVKMSDETVPPSEYDEALISRSGGYTSRDAFKARKEGKPAIFRFTETLSEGERVNIGDEGVKIKKDRESEGQSQTVLPSQEKLESEPSPSESLKDVNLDTDVTGTNVVPINSDSREDLSLDSSDDRYIDSFKQVFEFDGDKAILDARNLSSEALEEAVRYITASQKVILAKNPGKRILYSVIESGFDEIRCPETQIESVSTAVAEAERKFILDKLRDL
jgi:Phosphoenolpyruvate synthase/pyruvate phosphate dikinase